MNPALWSLLGMQLYSFVRFFTRSLRTVKGALLAGVGLLFIVPYLVGLALVPSNVQPVDPDLLRQNGPAIFLLYCVIQVLFNSTQTSLYFTPAEVQFLFPGPFTRREILLYKITLLTLLTLPVPMIFAVVFRQHAGSWLGAMLGMVFAIQFLTLFTVAVNLLVDSVGTALYQRTRWIVLLVAGVGLVVLLLLSGSLGEPAELLAQTEGLARMPLVRWFCWPLTWFFEVFLAPSLDGAFLTAVGMSLLVNYALLLVIFALDKNLLEMSAANSERLYAMIQQMRRGQSAVAVGATGTSWTLPDFPHLWGVGPVLWRQMMMAMRGFGRLVTVLLLIGVFTTVGIVSTGSAESRATGGEILPTLISMMIMMTFFMTLLVPFDFRGDLDNMPMLKSMPVSPWALVIGQLLTPTLVTTLFHWGLLAGVSVFAWQRGTPLPLLVVLIMGMLFPIFNFLMFGVENLLFLFFPVRMTQATPGDFQSLGRNILLALGKMLVLVVVVGGSAAVGVVVYFVTGNNPFLGMVGAGLVLLAGGLALLPAIVLAFARYDVGRDTPP